MLSMITHAGCLLAIFVSLMGQLNLNWVMWSSATHDYLVEVTELQLKLKYSSTEIDKIIFEDEIIAVEDKGQKVFKSLKISADPKKRPRMEKSSYWTCHKLHDGYTSLCPNFSQ